MVRLRARWWRGARWLHEAAAQGNEYALRDLEELRENPAWEEVETALKETLRGGEGGAGSRCHYCEEVVRHPRERELLLNDSSRARHGASG